MDMSPVDSDEVSIDEIRIMLAEKAEELFALCDKERKGFITKRDMQRLRKELPLTPEQLEDVFDNLDDDRNGFLTLQEFTDGFGSFLGIDTPKSKTPEIPGYGETVDLNGSYNEDLNEDEIDEEQFRSMLDHIGARDAFSESEDIRSMWIGMKRENPRLLTSFEEFLTRVSREMQHSKAEYANLEEAYKTRTNMHDEHVKKLYEEMETQIGLEKEKLLCVENAKEARIREELESELRDKDKILNDLLQKHKIIEERLGELNYTETETKHENMKLLKERDKLENNLEESNKMMTEMTDYIENLRKNASDERKRRARAALQASEGIALERESLVKQLDILKSMNQRLIDEKDESTLIERRNLTRGERLSDVLDEDSSRRSPKPIRHRLLEKRGSTIGDYLDVPRSGRTWKSPADRLESISDTVDRDTDFECDYDDSFYSTNNAFVNEDNNNVFENNLNITDCIKPLHGAKCNTISKIGSLADKDVGNGSDRLHSPNESDCDNKTRSVSPVNKLKHHEQDGIIKATTTEPPSMALWKVKHGIYPAAIKDAEESEKQDHWKVQKTFYTEKSMDYQNGNESSESEMKVKKFTCFDNPLHKETEVLESVTSQSPERVFKVVLIGDSCVGKTSFINRLCKETFHPSFSATIGVDFQVKSMFVDGRNIALQVWDTAGQERYRSITKQYFRRADGVVIMYDVTNEISFKNVRSWIDSVHEGADDHIVLMLVGNKIDMCEREDVRVIGTKDGEKLADEYKAVFYETSAKTGERVQSSTEALASLLQVREDEEIEKVLNLKDTKKKKCCRT